MTRCGRGGWSGRGRFWCVEGGAGAWGVGAGGGGGLGSGGFVVVCWLLEMVGVCELFRYINSVTNIIVGFVVLR